MLQPKKKHLRCCSVLVQPYKVGFRGKLFFAIFPFFFFKRLENGKEYPNRVCGINFWGHATLFLTYNDLMKVNKTTELVIRDFQRLQILTDI